MTYRRSPLPRHPDVIRAELERAESALERARRIVSARLRSQTQGRDTFERELLREGFSQIEADEIMWQPLPDVRRIQRRKMSLQKALDRAEPQSRRES